MASTCEVCFDLVDSANSIDHLNTSQFFLFLLLHFKCHLSFDFLPLELSRMRYRPLGRLFLQVHRYFYLSCSTFWVRKVCWIYLWAIYYYFSPESIHLIFQPLATIISFWPQLLTDLQQSLSSRTNSYQRFPDP